MAPTSQQPACMACLYGIVQAKCKLTSQVGAITHCLRFYYKPVYSLQLLPCHLLENEYIDVSLSGRLQ